MSRRVSSTRETKETRVKIELDLDLSEPPRIDTSIPFFDHLLHAFSFHGGFFLGIEASGDTEVDFHHLVEDVGLVLGTCLREVVAKHGAVHRFSSALIPMDEALAEVVIDVCGRPTAVVDTTFPQQIIGAAFDVALVREFLVALASRAGMSLHAHTRYGENSHHLAEALFKALGKAVAGAYAQADGEAEAMSTKDALLS